MARTNATNFTGPLQFPYATAGTDIFKKEDVQTLALAVDGHDHTSGKGLGISVGTTGIADRSVTSIKIQIGVTLTSPVIDTGGLTITSGNLTMTSGTLTVGTIVSGTNPATTGVYRLPNGTFMNWRNAANTANLALGFDSANRIEIDTVVVTPSGSSANLSSLVSGGPSSMSVSRWFVWNNNGSIFYVPAFQ